MTIEEITSLRKSGDMKAAYEAAKELYMTDAADRDARVALADCIKALMGAAAREGDDATLVTLLGEYASLHLDGIGEAELNNRVAWDIRALMLKWQEEGAFDMQKVRRLFDAVTELEYLRPHRYYSVLLDAFLKVSDDKGLPWAEIPEFVGWWNLENLLPEDFKRVLLTNGRPQASLAERAYTTTYKALLAALVNGEMRDEAEAFIDELSALEEAHPEFRFTMQQKTQLLKALGRTEEALQAACGVVRQHRNEFWAWSLLGDAATDEAERMACYCRALMCKANAELLGKVRFKLAVLMYNQGYLPEAKREIEKIINLYDYKGWPLPAGVEAVCTQEWFETTDAADSNRMFYDEFAARAEGVLMADVPETPVLITKYNQQKQTCSYATADHKRGYFSTRKMRESFADNQIWLMRFEGEPGGDRPTNGLTARRVTDITPYDNVFYRQVESEINMRPGMSFLFVDGIYIDGNLLREVDPGMTVVITAVLYYNIKKDQWGWRAVRLRPVD